MSDDKKFNELCEDVRDIKQAVLGDRKIGLTGLVVRVERAEAKLRRLDLRIAAVAGGVTTAVFIAEHFWK